MAHRIRSPSSIIRKSWIALPTRRASGFSRPPGAPPAVPRRRRGSSICRRVDMPVIIIANFPCRALIFCVSKNEGNTSLTSWSAFVISDEITGPNKQASATLVPGGRDEQRRVNCQGGEGHQDDQGEGGPGHRLSSGARHEIPEEG